MTAGENTTVYGVVSDVDVLNYAASTSELFEVTGTVIARQGVPIALPGETASDDVQLEIPEVFNLEVRIDDPVGPMNAGADTILRVFVQNNGNIADRVSETDVSVDCTLITVGTQTSEITNKEIAPGLQSLQTWYLRPHLAIPPDPATWIFKSFPKVPTAAKHQVIPLG